MKPRKFYLDIYDMTYFYALSWDKKAFSDWFTRKFGYSPCVGDETAATYTIGGENIIVIWTEDKSLRSLVHECVHAANFTLDSIGYKLKLGNDETQCYLVDLIFHQSKKKWS